MPMDDHRSAPALAIPRGRLVRSRVVTDLGTTLSAALERGLTGYVVVAPGDALLLDDSDGEGVLAFEAGVPTLAYHAGTDAGGAAALEAFDAGPCRVETYACDADALRAAAAETVAVPPGLPAERLAGDPGLVERTRERAPDDRSGDRAPDEAVSGAGPPGIGPDGHERGVSAETGGTDGDGAGDPLDAVEAFLDDEERIGAIRERAREEARRRAVEWGLDDHLDDVSE